MWTRTPPWGGYESTLESRFPMWTRTPPMGGWYESTLENATQRIFGASSNASLQTLFGYVADIRQLYRLFESV